ncbi:MAG: hypothetical protein DRP57_00330 [Spirochaetes bacterium]|nr:MAG: hypothetical protein DRP57_00330 [Spirochaetota bacterium]
MQYINLCAYIAGWFKRLNTVDVLDPTSSKHIIYCDTPDNPVDLAAAGSYAYICDRYGSLKITNLRADY